VGRVATFLSKTGLELEINLLHLRPQLFPITGAPLPKLVQDGAETKSQVLYICTRRRFILGRNIAQEKLQDKRLK
jgi:hypothetical protein